MYVFSRFLVATIFFASMAYAAPLNLDAACNACSGHTFINNGPCDINIEIKSEGNCTGANTILVPAGATVQTNESCCISGVKVYPGDCAGSDGDWPVECKADNDCRLPAPFIGVKVGFCGVSIE